MAAARAPTWRRRPARRSTSTSSAWDSARPSSGGRGQAEHGHRVAAAGVAAEGGQGGRVEGPQGAARHVGLATPATPSAIRSRASTLPSTAIRHRSWWRSANRSRPATPPAPPRLDPALGPEVDRGNLMEQCSSTGTSSHQPSASSPGGGGTVLTKGLRLRPLVPSGAHPPAGRTASLPYPRPTASPFARSSSPPTPTAGTARRRAGGCGRSSLTPGRAGWSQGHGSSLPPPAPRPRRPRAQPHRLTAQFTNRASTVT